MDTLEIYVIVKGDAVELLAEEILDIAETGALLKEVIGEDNIFFIYDPGVDITFIRFHGSSWAIPVAGFLDLLEKRGITFTADANRGIPYVLLRQPSEEIVNKAGKINLPPMGDIGCVIDYADRIHNQETVENTAKALEEMDTGD